jgi:hypothetical protein
MVFGAVLGPLIYWRLIEPTVAASLPETISRFDMLLIASFVGAAFGILIPVLILIAKAHGKDGPRRRPGQSYPKIQRLKGLGWSWESPYGE